jgi:hypothetical protein
MEIPTDDEIQQAFDAITKDGPIAKPTIELGKVLIRNPIFSSWLDRVGATMMVERGVLVGALLAGLNYGLRIGDVRLAAAAKLTTEEAAPDSITVTLAEAERQAVVLALAELALSRPGWEDGLLRPIAEKLHGSAEFDGFKLCNADRVRAERGPVLGGPRNAD